MKQLITILLAILTCSMESQDMLERMLLNSFQLDVGVNQLKDENLHAKVHTGLLYGLIYERTKQTHYLSNFGFRLHFSRLKTKYEEFSVSANAQIIVNYAHLIEAIKRNSFNYFVGPEIRLNYDLSFYPNWDESHLYWSNYLGLGIRNKLNYLINDKQILVFDLGLSIFSIINRPKLNRPYKIDEISLRGIVKNLHNNLEAVTTNKSLHIFFISEYQFRTGEKITQAMCYSFDYRRLQSNQGLPFQGEIHKIGLKIYFR